MRAPIPSLNHGAGNAMSLGQMHAPLGYKLTGKGTVSAKAAFVLIDIEHNTVIYSYKNMNGFKVGMMRRASIRQDRRGKFYIVRGKKYYL
jgi:hypothetical protein